MVAGRDLCTVGAVFKSLAFKEGKQFRCQLDDDDDDDDEKLENYEDQSSNAQMDVKGSNVMPKPTIDNGKSQFVPILRSGSCTDIGERNSMEDEHICIDDFSEHIGREVVGPKPNAYYGVFDGHCGSDAAAFVRNNLHELVAKDDDFLQSMKRDFDISTAAEKAVRNAFFVADLALADNCDVDSSSGTTVLIALIMGSSLLVANAGDCRAVLCRRGRAVEMSRDHKPNSFTERSRIEAHGGYVYDGYLNGELSVARALGDWYMKMKMPKGSLSPLSAEPEFRQTLLTEEDEFLIIGCDGIWDVMSSECAVTIARKELMRHNDPQQCSKELVLEALRRNTRDNLTVVVICFSAEPPPVIPVIERPRLRFCNISAEGLRNLRNLLEGV